MKLESCAVCNHQFDMGEVFELTPEERAAIGPDAPLTLAYCRSCLKVLRNRQQGAQLLKGVFEAGLRDLGVSDSKERAEVFHFKLVEFATKKVQ